LPFFDGEMDCESGEKKFQQLKKFRASEHIVLKQPLEAY
jgi:hypothetical protein